MLYRTGQRMRAYFGMAVPLESAVKSVLAALAVLAVGWRADLRAASKLAPAVTVDFNRDIRPILSENCFKCHGPDDEARKAKLRFDLRTEALKPAKSGKEAIVPGSPEKSELVARITATDPDDRMPPLKSGKKLDAKQIELLRRWIGEGARYATHWAYVKPERPALPLVRNKRWARNAVDRFILARLEKEGLHPSAAADQYTLIRRVSLDLTGLPPTLEEVDQFVRDKNLNAYDALVDRLLTKPSFGEHWARLWLDLARYADSAGYADDPPRTIWAYRDYVIKAFNANKPFDRFTVEQIAGDLLDDSDEEDKVATAFHRNTMTNNEGGTTDEEFRNAAVVDRVNTTMSVWMATSMGCAQCHTHKYDPITQQEYFRFLAFFNNTQDADLKDESPVLELFTPEQQEKRKQLQQDIARIEKAFKTPTPTLSNSQAKWEEHFPRERPWLSLKPMTMKARDGGLIVPAENNAVKITPQQRVEQYTLELPLTAESISGLRVEALPSAPNENLNRGYLITHVAAKIIAAATNHLAARYVRIEIPGKEKILSLAEVQVFKSGKNIALAGEASQSTTAFEGPAQLAIDGNVDGDFGKAKSTTHTESSENPWWQVDLKTPQPLERVVIWNRTDNNLQSRLSHYQVSLLDDKQQPVWEKTFADAPNPSTNISIDGSGPVEFAAIFADANNPASEPKAVIAEPVKGKKKGWMVEAEDGKPHYLTLLPRKPLRAPLGSKLEVTIEEFAQREHAPPALLRISASEDQRISEYASVPESILDILTTLPAERDQEKQSALANYYRENLAPELKADRESLKKLKKDLAGMVPNTVPIMRDLAGDKRRKTHLQFRGNYLALGEEMTEAVPAAFNPLPREAPMNRLTVARWLVDENNPLTARVIANRFWEQIFGVGIVRTSEDFGTQGDRPTHRELLDWLATELMAQKWNVKEFLKLLVTSSAYRQSSRVTPELQERDPDNLLLARGPRFRASAEIVRDQALAVSGLLSSKMYGAPVRPPQSSLGLTAAFGGSLDWKTSEGEDRYRRALYVEWRRTNPYASMATFDAPNREVCALRRPRSNTPLQALVTLNDPVYVEAAQALGLRMASAPGSTLDKVAHGFRLCLARPPTQAETDRLEKFYDAAQTEYALKPAQAKEMAPPSSDASPKKISELAAWAAVGNILLNLDETLMKP
jgi:mono/diheme cytochrome c family protein